MDRNSQQDSPFSNPMPGPSRMFNFSQEGSSNLYTFTSMNSAVSSQTSSATPGYPDSQDLSEQLEVDTDTCIELLEKMPPGVDPIKYLEDLQKAVLVNTIEKAVEKKLMKRHVNMATFESVSKQQKYVPPHPLLPLSKTQKSSSKSAPTTPVQPLLINEYQRGQQQGQAPASTSISTSISTQKNPKSSTISTIQPMDTSEIGVIPTIEASFVQLVAAVNFAKELKANTEPLLHLRSLSKKTLLFLDSAKYNLTKGQEKVVVQAGVKISELFDLCPVNSSDTGVPELLRNILNCLIDVDHDCMKSLIRGNFVHAVFGGMKSIKIRQLILETLYEAVLFSLNRICGAVSAQTLLDFDDITALYRFLQLSEYVIVTTTKELWIEAEFVKKLISLESLALTSIQFANIQIFLARVVGFARKFGKPDNKTEANDSKTITA